MIGHTPWCAADRRPAASMTAACSRVSSRTRRGSCSTVSACRSTIITTESCSCWALASGRMAASRLPSCRWPVGLRPVRRRARVERGGGGHGGCLLGISKPDREHQKGRPVGRPGGLLGALKRAARSGQPPAHRLGAHARIVPVRRCVDKGPLAPPGGDFLQLDLVAVTHRVVLLLDGPAGEQRVELVRREPCLAVAVVCGVRDVERSGARVRRVVAAPSSRCARRSRPCAAAAPAGAAPG